MAITTDPLWSAGRVSQRPLDYTTTVPGSSIAGTGHYRAVAYSGAAAVLSTTDIIASLRWTDANRYFVLTRLAMNVEVLTNVTVAPVFDAAAYVFRGSTGNASGTNSTTLTLTGDNNKDRKTMAASLFGNSGEIRTIGTTVKLTACAGKTNDSAPFGSAYWGGLYNSSSTGTAVLLTVGAAINGGTQDLFAVGPYTHPIVLQANEGIEVQIITANNTAGTVKYGFLWEWAEVAAF